MPTDDMITAQKPRVGAPQRRDVILELLRASAKPRGISSLADELGVHPNTVRFHIDALMRAGRVEQEQVLGDTIGLGRPPALFRASHRMDPAGPTNYRLLAGILTDYVAGSRDPARIATELGRSMSSSLVDSSAHRRASSKTQAVTELVEILADVGFKPEPAAGRRMREIRLRHCPFQSLAERHGEVICSLHLGLMQGALKAMRAPVTVDRLDPFVEPDLCVARLAPAATTGGTGGTS
jgi:predicted ArsR family transcriptional regulator